jgi:hypothetical protein
VLGKVSAVGNYSSDLRGTTEGKGKRHDRSHAEAQEVDTFRIHGIRRAHFLEEQSETSVAFKKLLALGLPHSGQAVPRVAPAGERKRRTDAHHKEPRIEIRHKAQ